MFYWAIAAAMAVSFMAAVLITFAMTVSRYVLAFSDPTAEYLSRYLVILGTFLGFPVAVLQSLHVRFDLVDYATKGRRRTLFQVGGTLMSMAICGVFAWAAWLFVEDSMMFGEIMPTGFDMPLWIAHATILAGMVLGVIAYAAVLLVGPIEPTPNADDPIYHP